MNPTANNIFNYQMNENTDYLKVNDWRMDFLCDYIETNHHKYIRKVMPKILSLSKSLGRKKIIDTDEYKELQRYSDDLETHMQKEERLLFPYIKRLISIFENKEEFEIPPFGSIANLIKVIEKEHRAANESLLKIKSECGGFKTKLNDDADKKMFYDIMNKFDRDFQMHVHFETNILYPKAISLEKKLKKLFIKNKKIN